MFVEQRCYTLTPGSTGDYLALYESEGMPIQLRYLPWMVGYYSSELGELNQIIHMWAHSNLESREFNRSRMRQDPEFQSYWSKVRPLVISQKTQILKPAPFFMARLRSIIDDVD